MAQDSTNHPLDPVLARLVADAFPGNSLADNRPLAGGISAQMTALTLADAEGATRQVVLRRISPGVLARNPHAARREFRLLGLLFDRGLPVPQPLHLADPEQFLAFLPGDMDLAPADPLAYARQMADMLARIHRQDVGAGEFDFLSGLVPPKETCRELAGRSGGNMDESLGEARIRSALAAPPQLTRRNPVGLIHGDFWPGNLIWREGALAGVIDWEDARLADPLVDLGMVRSELSWILGPGAMRTFTRRYAGQTGVDLTDLPYWDLCAALRFIRLAAGDLAGLAAFFQPYGRPDITPARIRAQFRLYVQQALSKS